MLLHDAVRPLVSQTIIAANVAALKTYEAVDTAITSGHVIDIRREEGPAALDTASHRAMTCADEWHPIRTHRTCEQLRGNNL